MPIVEKLSNLHSVIYLLIALNWNVNIGVELELWKILQTTLLEDSDGVDTTPSTSHVVIVYLDSNTWYVNPSDYNISRSDLFMTI